MILHRFASAARLLPTAASRTDLRRALTGLGLAVVLTFAAGTLLLQQRQSLLEEAEHELANVATVGQSWVGDDLAAITLLAGGIRDWLRAEDAETPAGYAARLAQSDVAFVLRGRMRPLPQVDRVILVDAQGRRLASSAGDGASDGPVVPEEDLAPMRDAGQPLHVTRPVVASYDGDWTMFVAHRLAAPDGSFLGATIAAVHLDHFEGDFARLSVRPGKWMGLVMEDGTLLARHPPAPEVLGQPLAPPGSAVMRVMRPLEGLPLVVVASRAVPEVLAPWRRDARQVGAMLLLLGLLIAGGVVAAGRTERQRAALLAMAGERAAADLRAHHAEETARSARLIAERDGALQAIYENGNAGLFEVDAPTGRYTRVSRRFCEIAGRREAELTGGLGPADVLHPDDLAAFHRSRRWADAAQHWEAELRYLRPDGSTLWARVSGCPSAFAEDGTPRRFVAIVQDITQARAATEKLRASEELLRFSMGAGRIGAYTRDLASGDISCGPETRALHLLPPGDGPMPFVEFCATILPEDRNRLRSEIAEAVARRQRDFAVSYAVRCPTTGTIRHMEARARHDYDAAGKALSAVGVIIDVTAQREAEARIAHIAQHDALTGLPNRLRFRERLDLALARARRGQGFAVLCLDLDRFKEVNDTMGHPVGDALLRAVADRLRAEVRETDTLARLGGDEFAIIQSSLEQPQDAIALARRLVEVVGTPFEIEGHHVVVGTSIGISVAPSDGTDADTLLKAADMALYRAKAEGRGRWRFFEPEMDARMQLRRAMELDLRRALAMNEFELHYQPIVDVTTRRISGFEALLRWQHPERGLVRPDHFIPLAEDIGLIIPLGEWVLDRACRDAARWQAPVKVAVNLSAVQFTSRTLLESVERAIRESGIAPGRLELEITETVMLQDAEAALATLHRLKALGVRIAMDDFGTGYSSLSYLQRFPFDKVKIDRSFTRELAHSRQSNAIIGAVTDLCAGLDMTTTAEGVETEEQFAALLAKGCQEAQGFLFSMARPAAEVAGLLDQLGAFEPPVYGG